MFFGIVHQLRMCGVLVVGDRVQKSVVPGSNFVEVLEYLFERSTTENMELRTCRSGNTVVHGGDFIFIHPGQ